MGDQHPAPSPDQTTPVLLAKKRMAIWLDAYDDILSHFDPRPYAERALSDDFLAEAKKVVVGRPEGVLELHYLMAASKRHAADETTIRERLHGHFQRHSTLLNAQRWQAIRRGGVLALVGVADDGRDTVATDPLAKPGITFLTVMLEPAGWYVVWFGLDEVFYGARKIATEHNFYRQMAEAQIVFGDY